MRRAAEVIPDANGARSISTISVALGYFPTLKCVAPLEIPLIPS
jgi:hypothetical protein